MRCCLKATTQEAKTSLLLWGVRTEAVVIVLDVRIAFEPTTGYRLRPLIYSDLPESFRSSFVKQYRELLLVKVREIFSLLNASAQTSFWLLDAKEENIQFLEP